MADNEPWDAQTLQVVWFSPRSREVSAEKVYQALTGREPDSVQTNRAPQPTNPFLGIAQGSLDHADAVVQVQQMRVDFFLNARPRDTADLPTIADTGRHLDELVSRFQGAAGAVPDAVRCAVVLTLVKPTSSLEEAASLVSEALNIPTDLRSATDLTFSANVRKEFAKGGQKMNRLQRWSADAYQMLNVQIGAQPMAIAPTATTLEQFGATHYIDVNTMPVSRPIEPGVLAELIGEMGAEAKRLRGSQSLKALEN
ncbi:hypothetical protein J2X36_002180 [Methylobacterium sp. BE186]|uniref:hypothetical protein n=1 Tax=Methylobacterium sp. BE186 TaxID=2817715 RepID=UPI0028552972|nr:hypothetical protein [Methylobacterium sp. BE186]MDR7037433.1 hypothetical protein [Methylobacterium sp. BE186]